MCIIVILSNIFLYLMLNDILIQQFKLLLNYIQYIYDNTTDQSLKKKEFFRLSSIKKALKIIINHPIKINSSNDLDPYYGIGIGIKSRVDEIIKTGKLSELDKIDNSLTNYEKKTVINENNIINQLITIIGIGRSNAHKLVHDNNIKSIDDLIKKKDKLDLNNNILMGLKYYNVYKQSIPRDEITVINKYLNIIANKINNKLLITICGSYRRGKSTSNDIDILITYKNNDSDDNKYLIEFIKLLKKDKFIVDSLTDENVSTKYMGFAKYKSYPIRRIDIRFVPYKYYYSALVYFTGPDELNKKMRKIAKQKGYKLSEYGLTNLKNNTQLPITTEEDIFNYLDIPYIKPNER